MKTLTSIAALMILAAASAMAGETKWWDYEYDGIGAPNAAVPAWGVAGSASGSQGAGVWIQATDGKWSGYSQGTAMPGGGETVEVRFRYTGSAEDGMLMQNRPSQWQAILQDVDGTKDVLELATVGPRPHIDLDEDWNIVRILYKGSSADVYALAGGDFDYNMGLWTPETLAPAATNWTGFGAGGGAYFQLGGAMEIDYVRWTDQGLFAPEGVPEPTSLVLLGIGAALLARRRRG